MADFLRKLEASHHKLKQKNSKIASKIHGWKTNERNLSRQRKNPNPGATVNFNIGQQWCPENIVDNIHDALRKLCSLKECLQNDLSSAATDKREKLTLLEKLNCCLECEEPEEECDEDEDIDEICGEIEKELLSTEITTFQDQHSRKCDLIRANKVLVVRLRKVADLEKCLDKIRQQKAEAIQEAARLKAEVNNLNAQTQRAPISDELPDDFC